MSVAYSPQLGNKNQIFLVEFDTTQLVAASPIQAGAQRGFW